MLKGISPVLSPDLLKALAEMGHSDRLVIADGNFPGHQIEAKSEQQHDIASRSRYRQRTARRAKKKKRGADGKYPFLFL